MSVFYFVEILNTNGDVHSRHKFSDFPIRIGRSYSNDIILDDPHTAAEHAIIEKSEAGTLVIRDLGSHNGLKLQGKRQTQIALHGDQIVHLGLTPVRVRDNFFVVPAEITDSSHSRWQGWPLFLIGLALICLISFSNTWVGDISNSKASDYIMSMLSWLALAGVWAGLWSLVNRLFGGSTHFSQHLFTLSVGIFVWTLLDYLCMLLGFSLSWEWATRYSSHVEISLLATLMYYHLRLIIPRKHSRVKWLCTALAVLGFSITLMVNYQHTNQYADELYMHEILPPAVRISRDHTLNEFNQSVQTLKADIDNEREKVLKEKAKK